MYTVCIESPRHLPAAVFIFSKYIPFTVRCFFSSQYLEIRFMRGSLVIATTTDDCWGLRNKKFCNACVFVKFRPLRRLSAYKNLELTELSTQSTSLVYQKINALNATLYLTSESPLSSLIKRTMVL